MAVVQLGIARGTGLGHGGGLTRASGGRAGERICVKGRGGVVRCSAATSRRRYIHGTPAGFVKSRLDMT